ncbi:CHAD domain-containing protein [Massilia antarctica]|uniref:CHAD domain-containing protein n=1 Tax=Massilia antarctica TaxID=2765360 RepID=UPI0006BB850A|nr:CHAD domain-containing protein [Massilia sp. H27-R4]MCY0914750.1 CHAD domain-containing protein [Massilia sp. H27-R4]CUI08213.1 Adenylate cyclase [Janthinobacterium sp. CG23_2]CUU31999.1 Adenylate cyclase [Janthinobacterium sp. CG23_2]
MDTAVRFPTTPKAIRARPLTLCARMNVEKAFQAIMRNCLDQIEANEHGVVKYHDVESLHQMRVGLRRLRSALGMFDEVLSLPVALRQELDWLVSQLGPVRDWDVLAGSTLPRIAGTLDADTPLVRVQHAAADQAVALHAVAGAAVVSERYQNLIGSLERWHDERGWRAMQLPADRVRLKMRIGDFAKGILEKDQQRLLKRGRKLKGADPAARHRVRIAAKKTRYAAEFFASLYPQKTVRPYVRALGRLQDELGLMNDASVADRLLRELSDGNDELKDGAGFLRGYLASHTRQGGGKLRKLWKRFVPLRAPG